MILTPTLGSLARLWSVSYSFERLARAPLPAVSLDADAFRSYARLAFEIFEGTVRPLAPSREPGQTARFLLEAPDTDIRRWERLLAHNHEREWRLNEVTNVAIATRDRMLSRAEDSFELLRPKLDEVPPWIREIVVHGGLRLFGDGTPPRQVNQFSSLTGVPPWMVAGVLRTTQESPGVLVSVFDQTPAEIGAQSSWTLEGIRAYYGDAFVEEALSGYRRLPSELGNAFWENLRASGHFDRVIMTSSPVPVPAKWRFSDRDSKVHFKLEPGDLKGARPRSLEIAPIFVLSEKRALKPDFKKLGLDAGERSDFVRGLWNGFSTKDVRDLADSLNRDRCDLPEEISPFLDLESGSLRIFLERKVRQKALRRAPDRWAPL